MDGTALGRQPLATDDLLKGALDRGLKRLLTDQKPEGYWWYTLEANESIGAGFIQLMHFLGEVDSEIAQPLARRIVAQQAADGSWPLFFGGPGDLSVTVECYLALRLAGVDGSATPLRRAREFILSQGGLSCVRVFTKIHLALFGLVGWDSCPAMPLWFILFPPRLGVSLYEFSSWARASIVPLLIILDHKPVVPLPFSLDELASEAAESAGPSWKNPFVLLDRGFKLLERLPWHPFKEKALERCLQWTRDHIDRTEDIYPAMAYAALAIKAVGFPNSDPTLRKAVDGLKSFQQKSGDSIHQQCCISPIWDTPWAGNALIEAGLDPADPCLVKAARYLIGKEIKEFRGDWRFKNPTGPAGGWSFEFQNDYFPDLDDTIEILLFLKQVGLPGGEKEGPIRRGLDWLLSMQSKNGGWAAFDKNNLSRWVNRIPFSDHGACLDPPTPDITGRMLELLSGFGYSLKDQSVIRAIEFLQRTQEPFGGWRGRWGVNYLYGTWAVLQGLAAIGVDFRAAELQKGVGWLKMVANGDGGWGESCLSDRQNRFVPLGTSVPSQTAWALLALMAAGESDSLAVERGIEWLIDHQEGDGSWEEPYHTGTGFPGHFYLKYHGYSRYFPMIALGRYRRSRPSIF